MKMIIPTIILTPAYPTILAYPFSLVNPTRIYAITGEKTAVNNVTATTDLYLNSNLFFPIHRDVAVLKNISDTNKRTNIVGNSNNLFHKSLNGKYITKNKHDNIKQIP